MTPDRLYALAKPPFQRWFSYRLPAPLEAEFEAESRGRRRTMVRRWMVAAYLFSWFGYFLQGTASQHWLLPALPRLLLLTPIFAFSFRALGPKGSSRFESVATVLPQSVPILIALAELMYEGPSNLMTAMSILCMGVLWVNTLAPMRVGDALALTVLTIGVGDVALATYAQRHGLQFADITIPYHIIVALSVVARFFAERDLRRTFLSGLALQKRADELARSNESLIAMANSDPLTGIANRRHFDRIFARAWLEAKAVGETLAILMIDVDHFKKFNDAAGHLEGDRCLTVVAKAIGGHARENVDVAARFGGEEFIVLLRRADEAQARQVAERILTAIEALQVFHPSRPDGRFVSVSIGVASTRPGEPSDEPAELIAEADAALYAAKQAGRGRARISASRALA